MYLNKELLLALRSGNTSEFLKNDKLDLSIAEQPLGDIFLPTGKIVANDPLCLFETEPFTESVVPGTYPVKLYILQINDDKRVAFAEITFSNETPESFQLAVTKKQNIKDLTSDEFFGYGVDSGTGCFMDYETCMHFETLMNDPDNVVLTQLDDALEKSYVYTYAVANVCFPNTKNNIIAFSSGYGDSSYPSFWGMNANKEICSLITDFCTVDDV